MTDLPGTPKALGGLQRKLAGLQRTLSGGEPRGEIRDMASIGIVGDAVSWEQISALSATYPEVRFEHVGAHWQERYPRHVQILVVEVDAGDEASVDDAIRRLKQRATWLQIVVVLRNANVGVTRQLAHDGAADVLPAPVADSALALCLERLMSRRAQEPAAAHQSGQIIVLLKAGGGVGATSLGVQATIALAERLGEAGRVCFADLDLQFGAASLHFDMPEALTIGDCLSVGEHLAETDFATMLTAHSSGARILAGPRDVQGLDTLTPALAEALVAGLRRDFAVTLIDLPAVWTAWTNRVVELADRIVLVTRLTVPHIHLVRRQLALLAAQKLDATPVVLVLNAVTPDQQRALPIKEAERAFGRRFQFVLPSDERVMTTATNGGLTLAAVRRGTKLGAGVAALADEIGADALASLSIARAPGS